MIMTICCWAGGGLDEVMPEAKLNQIETALHKAMRATRIWVKQGALERIGVDGQELTAADERNRFEQGEVRLTSGEIGTEIKWYAQTPCVASLFVVADWLLKARSPFVLRFYVSGWFEEFYQTAAEAADRLEAIISRGDRHFPVRTFVQQVEISKSILAPLITDANTTQDKIDDVAVECVYNRENHRFNVASVGKRSLIARVYGDIESSHPRQTTGSYSDAVNEGYVDVLQSGKPRSDHVLAALRFPNNNVYWVPYHRLILPVTGHAKQESVKVVAQFGSIGFKII